MSEPTAPAANLLQLRIKSLGGRPDGGVGENARAAVFEHTGAAAALEALGVAVQAPGPNAGGSAKAEKNNASAASTSKAAHRGDSGPTSARSAVMKRPAAPELRVHSRKRPAAGSGATLRRPPMTKAAAKAGPKHQLFALGGRLFRLGFDTKCLALMIKSARLQKPFPLDTFEHLSWYAAWLDTLPSKCMLGGTCGQPHLIRKHMLCHCASRTAAGFPLNVRLMSWDQLGRLSPDMSELMSKLPSQLTPKQFVGQARTPAPYISTWARLWKEALETPGAFDFVMVNEALLRKCLLCYQAQHGISPSPRLLVQVARLAMAAGDDARLQTLPRVVKQRFARERGASSSA